MTKRPKTAPSRLAPATVTGRASRADPNNPTRAGVLRGRLTDAKRAIMLTELAKGWSIQTACDRAGVGRTTAFEERRRNKVFAAAWDEAVESGTDVIEDTALMRAMLGTERPIFQGGKQVGTERVMSDRLMELMLKGRRPNRYRDRVDHKHGGDGEGGAIPVDIKGMTGAQLEILKQRLLAGLGTAVAGIVADRPKDPASD